MWSSLGMYHPAMIHSRKQKYFHTTKLDFLDYFRIKNMMKRHHQHPNFTITQHDKDKLTYQDAYDALVMVEAESKAYTSKLAKVQFNIDTLLCKKLVKSGTLSKKDILNIMKNS